MQNSFLTNRETKKPTKPDFKKNGSASLVRLSNFELNTLSSSKNSQNVFNSKRESKPLRIDRILSNFGYCTRNQARDWVKQGRIKVKNTLADGFAFKAVPHDLLIDDMPIDHPDGIYMAFHKPPGYTCSHDPSEGDIIYDLLPPQWVLRDPIVSSVGRLDKDTNGLLLLTDDTVLAHRLMSPSRHVAKVYRVDVDKNLTPDLIEVFKSGTLKLKEEKDPCLPAELKIISGNTGEVTLHEGRYHQIKRMFTACGYELMKLSRIKFGKLELGSLAEGSFREFGPEDI
jgi:16S rRNA pseudouridine516 synthase